ncbi:TetR/AcrR family transcriptional regulator [Eggerthella sinensis]|uniref:TetR/AcrR family transcriptional regulator n=1 Tax=Eggerthella sinensis TaxID=242230 RepID=A0A3N0J2X3_9ACTN|nr:TetR/AcrR family transcriptional regulator [Eggerthella sinensis]RDB71467.1 TetR/AcrR family transcriptional regulator [Eggerthella sinensis]RNM43326.1 TetR/AcrR family transcriptional regulator [Eggerthella sinensis]
MTEAPQRRERQDAVKNRGHILRVAQELFDRFGVETVSMNRIAQEAGVGAGTLYRHFGNKSELCFALIQDRIATFSEELAALVAADEDPRVTFGRMVRSYLRFKESKALLFKGMEEAAAHTGGPKQSPAYHIMRQPFVELFERAARVEGIETPVNPVFHADLLLSALIGDALRYQQEEHHLTTEEFAEGVCRVFYPHG